MSVKVKSLQKGLLSLFLVAALSQGSYAKDASSDAAAGGSGDDMSLSLEDILNVKVSVASLFNERELDVGSSVASITSAQWEKQGAKRTLDALRYIPGVSVIPGAGASTAFAIRGYGQNLSTTGISMLIDGIPINSFSWGSGLFARSQIDLGILDRIEVLRGPGSTIYGSDAFHGVISMMTPKETKNVLSMDAQYGSFGYHQANMKFSRELFSGWRLSGGVAASGQKGENVDWNYQEMQTLPNYLLTNTNSAWSSNSALARTAGFYARVLLGTTGKTPVKAADILAAIDGGNPGAVAIGTGFGKANWAALATATDTSTLSAYASGQYLVLSKLASTCTETTPAATATVLSPGGATLATIDCGKLFTVTKASPDAAGGFELLSKAGKLINGGAWINTSNTPADDRSPTTLGRNYHAATANLKLTKDKFDVSVYYNQLNAYDFPGVTAIPFFTYNSTLSTGVPLGGNFPTGNHGDSASNFMMVKAANTFELGQGVELETRAYHWTDMLENAIASRDTLLGNASTAVDMNNMDLLHSKSQRDGFIAYFKRPATDSFPVQWVAGYTYDYNKNVEDTNLLPSVGKTAYVEGGQGLSRAINSLVAQTDTALFSKKLHVLVGGRYDAFSDIAAKSHASPRVGLIYQPTNENAIKLLYGNSFRAPFAGELGGSSLIKGKPDLDPETLDMVELIYQQRSKTFKLDLGGFVSLWSKRIGSPTNLNLIGTGVAVSDKDGNALPGKLVYAANYENGGLARAFGFEWDTRYNSANNWGFMFNGSYIYSMSEAFISNASGVADVKYRYSRFPQAMVNWGFDYDMPKQHMSFNVINHHEMARQNGSYTEWGTLGDAFAASPGVRQDVELESYWRTDVGASWEFKSGYTLTGNIRNLFDRKLAVTSVWNTSPEGIPEAGISTVVGIKATL